MPHKYLLVEHLAVDRDKFSEMITETIKNHPNINVIEEEITQIPKGDIPVVVATGPLTSDALSQDIRTYTKQEGLYFMCSCTYYRKRFN